MIQSYIIYLLIIFAMTVVAGAGLNLLIGGTGILIVVSVVIETLAQIEAQLTMHEYET